MRIGTTMIRTTTKTLYITITKMTQTLNRTTKRNR